MNRPDNVSVLDQKPGRDWTAAEASRAEHWWKETCQQKLVWMAAYQYLGAAASCEDVEDAWAAFYATECEKARRSYRCGGPDFATYAVHVCFKRECVRRGEVIRRHRRTTMPLVVAAAQQGMSDNELPDPQPDPQTIAMRSCTVAEVVRFLAVSEMPPQQRRAFELKHFEEMSIEEVAWELGAKVSTVKVWVRRAAQRVKEHLERKGG